MQAYLGKKSKLGRTWDGLGPDFGTVWGYVRDDFGSTLKNPKNWEFRIQEIKHAASTKRFDKKTKRS